MMKTNILKFSVLVFIVCLSFSSWASHLAGGNMQIKVVGQDTFKINLTLYRDCSGISMPLTESVIITDGCGVATNITVTQESSAIMPVACGMTTCQGGIITGYEKYVYSALVVNSSICGSLEAVYSVCCRPSSVNLQGQGNMHLDAKIFTNVAGESTPVIVADGMPRICNSTISNYNALAYDENFDSVYTTVEAPLTAANSTVMYNMGYTATQPIPGFTLDGNSGLISVNPSTLGIYSYKLKIADYDPLTGTLKGYSTLDHGFVVLNCASNAQSPAGGTVTNLTNASINAQNEIEFCNSNSVTFDLVYNDADTADSLSILSNLTQTLPGATYTVSGTNPLTFSVTIPTGSVPGLFTISTKVSDWSCANKSTYFSYPIRIVGGTFASNDVTICSGDWVDLSVTGGTSFTWTALSGSLNTNPSSAGYNASCTSCQNPSFKPTTTTSYVVTSNLSGSCINTDTVEVTVASNFTLNFPADTTFCGELDFQLPVSASDTSVTAVWSPNAYVNNDSILNPQFATQLSGAITLIAENSGGCQKVETYSFSKSEVFPNGSEIIGDTLLCAGDTASFSVDLGDVFYDNCGSNSTLNQATLQTQIVGSLATANANLNLLDVAVTNGINGKMQIIYRESDLVAMGMTNGGVIESVAFNFATVRPSVDNFTIRIGCTSLNDLSSASANASTEVYNASTQSLSTGWNTFAFSTPYVWSGQGSLVIQICAGNAFSWSVNTTFMCNGSGYISTLNEYPNVPPLCSSGISGGITGSARPVTRFGFRSDFATNQVTYNWIGATSTSNTYSFVPTQGQQTISAVISNSAGTCVDTISSNLNVVGTYNPSFGYTNPLCPNEPAQQLTTATPNGVFTGTGVSSTGTFDPAVAGPGIWPITHMVGVGSNCQSDTTQFLVVNALPDAGFDTVEVCINSAPFNITPNTLGGTFYGPQITDSVNGTFNPNGLGYGFYPVTYEVTDICTNRDTGVVRIIAPYNLSQSSGVIQVCQGEVIDLNNKVQIGQGTNYGSNPTYSWTDANGNVDSNGIFSAMNVTPGVHQVTVEASSNGACSGSLVLDVQVLGMDQPEFTSNLTYCVSELTGRLEAVPFVFGNGANFTITPLFGGDTLVWQPLGANLKFNPSNNGTGEWRIELAYTNVNGCTGYVADTLRIIAAPDTSVTVNGPVLEAVNQMGYSYQWYACDGTIQSGETSSQFTPSDNGTYYVELTVGSCIATSGCHAADPNGIIDAEKALISAYPNPVSDQLFIDLGNQTEVEVVILNTVGMEMYRGKVTNQTNVINVGNWATGMYMVNVKTNTFTKTISIVKQ